MEVFLCVREHPLCFSFQNGFHFRRVVLPLVTHVLVPAPLASDVTFAPREQPGLAPADRAFAPPLLFLVPSVKTWIPAPGFMYLPWAHLTSGSPVFLLLWLGE